MIYRREKNRVVEVRNPNRLHKRHLATAFEEEAVRERALAMDDEELEWAIDALTKAGRLRGAILC